MSFWTSAVRAISHGEKHVLKGLVRGKQAPEMRCLAETRHGDSQEARIALRGISTLTYLACDVSQWSQKPPVTPIGKPPPLAVRLAEALPFRRAQGSETRGAFNVRLPAYS